VPQPSQPAMTSTASAARPQMPMVFQECLPNGQLAGPNASRIAAKPLSATRSTEWPGL
jgi:hypothetical protein